MIDRKSIATLATGTALTLAGVYGSVTTAQAGSPAHTSRTSHVSPVITWVSNRPCKQEDSVNCAWNAQEQGNRHGHSFIVRQFPGKAHLVCVMYDERRFAKHHDYCA